MDPKEYKQRALAAAMPNKWARREGNFLVEEPSDLSAIFAEMNLHWPATQRPIRWHPDPMNEGDLVSWSTKYGQRVHFAAQGRTLALVWTWHDDRTHWMRFMRIVLGHIDLTKSTPEIMRPFEGLREQPLFWKAARDAVARARYDRRRKSWDDVLPNNIVTWALDIVAGWDNPCTDNIRAALMSSPSQMRRFRKQRNNGCCGSHEETLKGPDGKKYLLGCNFGH